jgi:hypothetical protein
LITESLKGNGNFLSDFKEPLSQKEHKTIFSVFSKKMSNWANVQYFVFYQHYPFSPATTAVFGSYLSSLYSKPTLYRLCGLAYPYDGRGFVGPKKKTIVGS